MTFFTCQNRHGCAVVVVTAITSARHLRHIRMETMGEDDRAIFLGHLAHDQYFGSASGRMKSRNDTRPRAGRQAGIGLRRGRTFMAGLTGDVQGFWRDMFLPLRILGTSGCDGEKSCKTQDEKISDCHFPPRMAYLVLGAVVVSGMLMTGKIIT